MSLFRFRTTIWSPPFPTQRPSTGSNVSVRTRREIDAEKYALKVLRGDFDGAVSAGKANPDSRAREAWQAVHT